MPAPPEALLTCPLCRDSVAAPAFDEHLRKAHGLLTYRNVRRSFRETLETIFGELLTPRPSAVAWSGLAQLARDESPDRPEEALAGWLSSALADLPGEQRDTITTALAPLAAQPPLVAALAAQARLAGKALALAAHRHLKLDRDGIRSLRGLLMDRQIPPSVQIPVLAAVLPSLDDSTAGELADALVAGLRRAQAIRLLRSLEKRSGRHPVVKARRDELQENAKLACPRCRVELRRAAMAEHLWNEHRLILDGMKTREPWAVVEEWLDNCRGGNASEWLERCRVAAGKIDPENGQLRLARLIQAHGLADADSRRLLLSLAREQHASCCPWCYALVGVPSEEPPPFVNLRPGRLSARGYEVRLDESGPRTKLEVRTPDAVVYQGHEPGRTWTAYGLSCLVTAPLVALGLLFSLFWPASLGPPVRVTVVFLALAALAFLAARLYGRLRPSSPATLLRYAWNLLVPRLHVEGFSRDDAAFVAGLARLSERVGFADVDAEQVGQLVRLTEPAAAKGAVPPEFHAALCRLWIESEARRGGDPVPLVAELMAKAFEGRLPFSFGQRLLEEWAAKWWTKTNLARLRILLCDRAFEAGFEAQSLLDAGQNAPALGAVLGTNEPRSLAALRLLWSLRPTRPWDRLGAVMTAYELAASAELAGPLGEQRDLLLYLRNGSCLVGEEEKTPAPATIRLTPLGVWLQGVLFRIPPREVGVRLRGSGCTLTMGYDTFHGPEDLEPLSREMERWFRYGFHELLPAVDRALSWQSPDRAAILRAWGAVPCPECGRHLLPRAADVGMALEERA